MDDRFAEWQNAYTTMLLARLSGANRELVTRYLDAKRAQGLKPNSLINVLVALGRLDSQTNGTKLAEISPDALTSVLGHVTASYSPATASSWATLVKSFYRWLHDDTLPKPIQRALKRQARHEWKLQEPLTSEEFQSLLEAASKASHRRTAARRRALIWLLWDSGFRVSEALALRIGDFHPDARGGANLTLPPGAARLKTGPRSIYVVECRPALEAWIALHPYRADPSAPLLVSTQDPAAPMVPYSVNKLLKKLTSVAGLRHINPHLFRHTRATRAALAGWNEPQMRMYFGWAPGSDMPSRYIHLSQRNMEDRVLQDAGADQLGRLTQQDSKAMLAQTLAKAIETALAKRGIALE